MSNPKDNQKKTPTEPPTMPTFPYPFPPGAMPQFPPGVPLPMFPPMGYPMMPGQEGAQAAMPFGYPPFPGYPQMAGVIQPPGLVVPTPGQAVPPPGLVVPSLGAPGPSSVPKPPTKPKKSVADELARIVQEIEFDKIKKEAAKKALENPDEASNQANMTQLWIEAGGKARAEKEKYDQKIKEEIEEKRKKAEELAKNLVKTAKEAMKANPPAAYSGEGRQRQKSPVYRSPSPVARRPSPSTRGRRSPIDRRSHKERRRSPEHKKEKRHQERRSEKHKIKEQSSSAVKAKTKFPTPPPPPPEPFPTQPVTHPFSFIPAPNPWDMAPLMSASAVVAPPLPPAAPYPSGLPTSHVWSLNPFQAMSQPSTSTPPPPPEVVPPPAPPPPPPAPTEGGRALAPVITLNLPNETGETTQVEMPDWMVQDINKILPKYYYHLSAEDKVEFLSKMPQKDFQSYMMYEKIQQKEMAFGLARRTAIAAEEARLLADEVRRRTGFAIPPPIAQIKRPSVSGNRPSTSRSNRPSTSRAVPPPPPPPKKKTPKWRRAKDAEGDIYFYNKETQQTTWDFPGEGEVEDCPPDEYKP